MSNTETVLRTMFIGDWEIAGMVTEDGKLTLNVCRKRDGKIYIEDNLSDEPHIWQETFFYISDGEESDLAKRLKEKKPLDIFKNEDGTI